VFENCIRWTNCAERRSGQPIVILPILRVASSELSPNIGNLYCGLIPATKILHREFSTNMLNKYSNGSVGRYKTHAGQNCYTIVKRLKFQEAITSFEVQTDGARLERAGRHPSLKRGSLIQVPSTEPIFTCEWYVQIITTRTFHHLIWDKTTSGKPEWLDMTY
jgi:hypothetical protein